MDEHGIAAALLPLVTAFCRVSTCSALMPAVASQALSSLEATEAGSVKGREPVLQPGQRQIVPSVPRAWGPVQELPATPALPSAPVSGPRVSKVAGTCWEGCSETGDILVVSQAGLRS